MEAMNPVRAILYTWLTFLRATDDLYDATLEYTRGKFYPVWHKIRNYRFGIFSFDAELEWCKFRALTVTQKTVEEWIYGKWSVQTNIHMHECNEVVLRSVGLVQARNNKEVDAMLRFLCSVHIRSIRSVYVGVLQSSETL